MLKIGEFSKLSRVSVRMLRHYDEIGLLKPVRIDEFTGYRYYHERQLIDVSRIRSLKEVGFSLSEIGQMLAFSLDPDQTERFFQKRKAELLVLSEQTARQMLLLESARVRLRKEQTMSYHVSIKTIP